MAELEKLLCTDSRVEAVKKINALIENGGGGKGAGAVMFDTKISDHILTDKELEGWALQGTYVYKNGGTDRVGYPDFYNECLTQKNIAVETEVTLGDSAITIFKHNNGHQFFNIADKSIVDTFYETYGIADFYGIDEENERIFLPRNKYFAVKGIAPVVGNGKALGLTDGTNNLGLENDSSYGLVTSVQAYGQAIGSADSANFTGRSRVGVTTDETESGAEAHLKPNENKYLYYCVGNTQVTSAVTDVTEITTSENDTLPWGYNFYSGDLLEAPVGYVASLGQWNRGQEWQSFYDRAVAKIGQPFADGYIKEYTETYDDYDLVINQDDMTFRLPLLNGKEDLPDHDNVEEWDLIAKDTAFYVPRNGFLKIRATDTTYANINQGSCIYSNTAGTSTKMNMTSGLLTKDKPITIHFEGTLTHRTFTPAKGNGNLYFKLANAVQNLELLNVGEVMDGLALKADLDLDNANPSQTFKEQSITWGIPDYTAGVSRTANVEYIAECAGYISGYISGNNKTLDIYINGNKIIHTGGGGIDVVMYHAQAFVDKGDTYKLTDANYIFYPLKGTK